MTEVLFSSLGLTEQLEQGMAAMGFETATPIQAQTIPLIRTGVDVIAKSRTGTGKTLAFAIPALESIDCKLEKNAVQVLIICPTRELAQQAADEIRKAGKFMPGIRPVELYGGTDMERQLVRLRRANLAIGTPGRIMDHLRRKSLKLENLKMVVLDEADEMLNMGFKEDIETILLDAPENRQTILFSATMPAAILSLAKKFQNNPQMVEIGTGEATIAKIDQIFVEIPQTQKTEALAVLLEYHRPQRALVFCNTKRMVDELGQALNQRGFAAEGIHGDLSQSQRSAVMSAFKGGRVSILLATDVAARGIDVNDLDYVFNFDIPMTTEYYIHRIGRTARAGKSGTSITLCCGKRQFHVVQGIARTIKAEIRKENLPTADQLKEREWTRSLSIVEATISQGGGESHTAMVDALVAAGHTLNDIAATALALHFPLKERKNIPAVSSSMEKSRNDYEDRSAGGVKRARLKPQTTRASTDLLFDIGSSNRITANHLVGAITERAGISGREIGQIQIFMDQSVVSIPTHLVDDVMNAMQGGKICGKPARVTPLAALPEGREIRSRKPAFPRPKPKRFS